VLNFGACNTASETQSVPPGALASAKTSSIAEDSKAEDVRPPSLWRASTSRNELTSEVEVTAVNGFGDKTIVVRKRGTKLDLYVTTDEFLETVDNMNTRRSTVKYKFDNGPIIREAWIISDDNSALFYPGSPRTFLQKMSNAKRFVIDYSPSEKIPQTESFDVFLFPPELTEILSKGKEEEDRQ
jgi:hypothetical protein